MGKFNFKKEDFEKVKEEAKKFYAAIRKTIRLKNTAIAVCFSDAWLQLG